MPNMKTIISNRNKSALSKSEQSDESKNCNCRNHNAFPMDGNCNDQNIVYQAEIKAHRLLRRHNRTLRHDVLTEIQEPFVFIQERTV